MTSLATTAKDSDPVDHEQYEAIEQIKMVARARKLRAARLLAERIQTAADGSRTFVRFGPAQRLEHQLLLVTFTGLAATGLLQHYSQATAVGLIINVLGGVDTLRIIHHVAAIVMILQCIYHVEQILVLWFVKRQLGAMWPGWRDVRDLVHMLRYNLGLAPQRPEFDRFSIEEKLEYWALLWGTPLMIVTGLVMWFPTLSTMALPGDAVPVSRALHAWEAILATLAILTWHMYHTVIKERNTSIFTGTMTEHEMQHSHPVEYRRIVAAYDYLQRMVTGKTGSAHTDLSKEVRHQEAASLRQAN